MQSYFDKSGEYYVRLLKQLDNQALSRQIDRERAIAITQHIRWMLMQPIYQEYFQSEAQSVAMYDCINNTVIAAYNRNLNEMITVPALPVAIKKPAEALLDLFQLYGLLPA